MYDVLILDLPSTVFLDIVPFSINKSDKIFFVLNPNYISVRQAIKYLDLITNIWGVSKEKIYLIVNKTKKDSLSENQISALFRDYNIVLNVKNDDKVEKIINGMEEIGLESIEQIDKLGKIFGIDIENKRSENKVRKWL